MKLYVRSKVNGMIFDWSPSLARNPEAEVITEAEAYPERSMPKEIEKREPKVSIKVKEETEAPNEAPPALRAEATKKAALKVTSTKIKQADFAGLMGDF